MTLRRSCSSWKYASSKYDVVLGPCSRLYRSSSGYCTSATCWATNSVARRSRPFPTQCAAVCAALVNTAPAGASVGLFGSLLSAVIWLLSHAIAANTTTPPATAEKIRFIFALSIGGGYGVTCSWIPNDFGFASEANSTPWKFPACVENSGSMFGTFVLVHRL